MNAAQSHCGQHGAIFASRSVQVQPSVMQVSQPFAGVQFPAVQQSSGHILEVASFPLGQLS
jgi:hypothetical protein